MIATYYKINKDWLKLLALIAVLIASDAALCLYEITTPNILLIIGPVLFLTCYRACLKKQLHIPVTLIVIGIIMLAVIKKMN